MYLLVYTVKTYGGGNMTLPILNLGTNWKILVSLTPRLLQYTFMKANRELYLFKTQFLESLLQLLPIKN
jgi:hypothetical protein